MRKKKRDMGERAFTRGYQAGYLGKSKDLCPHNVTSLRHEWLSGWREGRTDHSVGPDSLVMA